MLPREEVPLRVKAREFLIGKVFSRLLVVLEKCEALFFRPGAGEAAPEAKKTGPVLLLLHVHGGGVEKQARMEAERLTREGRAVYFLAFRPLQRRFVLFSQNMRRSYFMPWQWGFLRRRLKKLSISEIRLHHARYWPDYAVRALPDLTKNLGAQFIVMLHDYIYLCPRITLLDGNYRFCGLPADPAICDKCVEKGGSLIRYPGPIGEWRQRQAAFMKSAHRIIAPSFDAAARYGKIFSGVGITVKPHEGEIPATPSVSSMIPAQGLRLAVAGNLLRHKGADCVLQAARLIKEERLPIKLRIIGSSVYRPEFARLDIPCTGPYGDDELAFHLRKSAPDYVWLPSPWPETYSFVLSEAWRLGYPVITFDIGAQGERIRKRGGRNRLLPLALSEDIPGLCAALLQLQEMPAAPPLESAANPSKVGL